MGTAGKYVHAQLHERSCASWRGARLQDSSVVHEHLFLRHDSDSERPCTSWHGARLQDSSMLSRTLVSALRQQRFGEVLYLVAPRRPARQQCAAMSSWSLCMGASGYGVCPHGFDCSHHSIITISRFFYVAGPFRAFQSPRKLDIILEMLQQGTVRADILLFSLSEANGRANR